MRGSHLLVVFLTLFLVTLVTFLPARLLFNLAAPNTIQADIVSGTAWSMRLKRLNIADQRISTGHITVSPLALLSGSIHARLALTDRQTDLTGLLKLSPGTIRVSELTMILPPERLPPLQASRIPLSSPILAEIDTLVIRQGQCLEAQGQIITRVLTEQGDQLGLSLPVLTGDLTCTDTRPVITLSGQTDLLSVSGFVSLGSTGYRWSAVAQTQNRDVMAVLLALEFEQSGSAWRLEGDGLYP